ncbi:MAG: hypothetical protein FJZ93_09925 [Chloroflexi bacterium]|nr:hypothetical protein [Chloroflexota bacterium]
MKRYVLYIGGIADVLFTVFGAPALALQYIVPALKLNPVVWVPYVLFVLIWLFCTGYWGMGKIFDAYKTFRKVAPAS